MADISTEECSNRVRSRDIRRLFCYTTVYFPDRGKNVQDVIGVSQNLTPYLTFDDLSARSSNSERKESLTNLSHTNSFHREYFRHLWRPISPRNSNRVRFVSVRPIDVHYLLQCRSPSRDSASIPEAISHTRPGVCYQCFHMSLISLRTRDARLGRVELLAMRLPSDTQNKSNPFRSQSKKQASDKA
jgi:hypothetical protein